VFDPQKGSRLLLADFYVIDVVLAYARVDFCLDMLSFIISMIVYFSTPTRVIFNGRTSTYCTSIFLGFSTLMLSKLY
jgi:hypothetical protein